MSQDFLYPILVMAALTFLVWIKMMWDRIGEMIKRRIRAQELATSRQSSQLQNIQASDNFRNLFELPVLFYVLCLAIILSHAGNLFLLVGAWIFVAIRCAHSLIHCTYNKVMHRFLAHMGSTLTLMLIWIGFACGLLLR